MHRSIRSVVCCAILSAPVAAWATPPPADAAVVAVVEQKLVAPLQKKEADRSRFSRAAPMPKERRVRLLDEAQQTDARGRAFRAFAVDARHRYLDDGPWSEGAIVGCVYTDDEAIYVKVGDDYRPGALLLGKKSGKPPAAVCVPADGKVAHAG